jgi:integrase
MATITDKGMQAKPTATDQWLTQPFMRGAGVFMGRITTNGERLFYFRYTDSKGRRPFLSIGPYHPKGKGGLTLAQAYEKACEWSLRYTSGAKDLREHLAQQQDDAQRADQATRQEAERRAEADALERERRVTVRQLFDRWREVDLQSHVRADGKRAGRKDGGQYTLDQFERYVFPTLGSRVVADLRKADVLVILDEVKSAGKLRTANVLLSDLKQMLAFALVREIIERNPLDTVTRRHAGGVDAMRERVLSTDEIVELVKRIPEANLNPRTATAIWLLLATGARIGELMGAVWADKDMDLTALAEMPGVADVKLGIVDTATATWHLPTTKNEREHTIHLSSFALAQFKNLAALRQIGDDGKLLCWVFPNAAGSGPVCVKSFGKQLADRQKDADRRMQGRSKKCESLKLPGGKWTAHDLRRTAGTLMASLGVSGDVIDECLNHVIESRVRRTYIRDRRPIEQASAFDRLGGRLSELVTFGRAFATFK